MQVLIDLILAMLILVPPASAETIYVSNEQDNTVAVVDGVAMTLQTTIDVGRRPRGMALSIDKKTLFVAEGDDNRIDVIDLAKRQVVGRLPSGADPEFFVVHPDGKRLFVANENDNLVSVVDIAAGKVTGTIDVGVEPEGMAVSADGRTVACTSETTSMVHLIDAGTLELIDNLLVDTRPRAAAFSPDDKQLWVSSEIRGTVAVFDTATRAETGKIEFEVPGIRREGVQAVGIEMSRDGTTAYVALGPANRVAEVDTKTLAVRRLYLVGQRPWHVALSDDQKRLISANGNSGDISFINLHDQEVVRSLPVGRGPWGVVIGP
ncbi:MULTISPECIES: PQQ-dependent catabolism-associated beta-propeller protein [unclassified Mesorhizobium]|uniref:PQQ-dependent catabolism-associated beta-propeller protein n=1 Tax=unclassified Mesorhizobium TaxID=325217 RepID=UPI001CCE40B9|nr:MULTISPECIES: PQQ-dependent catabolism-associated beta-propeller protein [unclassified Mesorhizobium]MBZ9684542.1 PQQ-dependent catabolism-associated beta-propeller protein [Mesorhizobium sp. CO1-1-2]MBZ9698756.1 PQQ-dependent catabolism-associated beta-propeller protein [Mesorhizobium sp. CO1-1-9]MBZ9923773.1 PQQ-dependent catabolism-associated beta-propeller protein [Mesorhizobium sp. BR1-1-4]